MYTPIVRIALKQFRWVLEPLCVVGTPEKVSLGGVDGVNESRNASGHEEHEGVRNRWKDGQSSIDIKETTENVEPQRENGTLQDTLKILRCLCFSS